MTYFKGYGFSSLLVLDIGEKEKITLAVDKRGLDLFKEYANKHNAKYQTMINGVISSYAEKFLSRKK